MVEGCDMKSLGGMKFMKRDNLKKKSKKSISLFSTDVTYRHKDSNAHVLANLSCRQK